MIGPLQHRRVDDPAPLRGRVVRLEGVGDGAGADSQEGEEANQVVAERDDDARRQRQLGAESRKQRREGRDDLPQNEADDRARDDDDGDRIDHRRLHLALQLHGLFDVGREPLENRVEDAARLARRHHVREQRIERLRMLAHRIGERGARLDVGARLQNDGREVLVLFLGAQNVEALDERKARVDHDGELTGEDGEVLRADLLAGLAHSFFFAAASSLALAGVIRVTMICSRLSAATAASIESALRSPVTFSPARVRPEYANVVAIRMSSAFSLVSKPFYPS